MREHCLPERGHLQWLHWRVGLCLPGWLHGISLWNRSVTALQHQNTTTQSVPLSSTKKLRAAFQLFPACLLIKLRYFVWSPFTAVLIVWILTFCMGRIADIDECESSPCIWGNCSDSNTDPSLDADFFLCTCEAGYSGTTCNWGINFSRSSFLFEKLMFAWSYVHGLWKFSEIQECDSDPCVYGTCVDLVNYYTCTCAEGYSGYDCEYGQFKRRLLNLLSLCLFSKHLKTEIFYRNWWVRVDPVPIRRNLQRFCGELHLWLRRGNHRIRLWNQ